MNGQERVIAYRSADSFAFFYGICSSDDDTRSLALNGICEVFNRWLDGYGSPPGGRLVNVTCGSEYTCSSDPRIFIREQLPDLLRLSIDCPFSDVRERCSEILSDLQVCRFSVCNVTFVYLYLYLYSLWVMNYSRLKLEHLIGIIIIQDNF